MSNLQLSPHGRRDIDEIYDYIARRDQRPLTADNVVRKLQEACQFYADSIASGFMIGTARSDLGEAYRIFTHKRWVILFRPIHDGIEVLRVVDGSRDFTRTIGK
jgi:plasmid stabilization system protein ParE